MAPQERGLRPLEREMLLSALQDVVQRVAAGEVEAFAGVLVLAGGGQAHLSAGPPGHVILLGSAQALVVRLSADYIEAMSAANKPAIVLAKESK